MKRFKVAKWLAALAVLSALLLTSCGEMPPNSGASGTGSDQNQGSNTSTSTGSSSSETENEDSTTSSTGTGTVFEQALNNAFTLPSSFDGWHYIIDDYDGDGRQEAFAFAGQPSGDGWNNISIFYIDPNGNITKLLWNSQMTGGPQNTESTSDKNYSSSCISYKNEKFVVFWLGPDSACPYSMVYGVHNGSVTKEDIDGTCVRKVPEGFICAAGLDIDYAYVVKNGRLVDMFTTSDAYKYIDPDYSMKTTPLKDAWKAYTEYSQMGNKEYFLQGDYDGDGRQEAYVIRGYFKDGYASSAEICYIGWGGTVLLVGGGNGQLLNITKTNYKTSDSIIYAGNQKFMVWQVPGAGHAATYLYGARCGVPYQPQISGNVSFFHQNEDGRYYAEGNEKYTEDEYLFNASTGQFYRK